MSTNKHVCFYYFGRSNYLINLKEIIISMNVILNVMSDKSTWQLPYFYPCK